MSQNSSFGNFSHFNQKEIDFNGHGFMSAELLPDSEEQSLERFMCSCGIPSRTVAEVNTHYFQCGLMQSEYSELIMAVKNMQDKAQHSVEKMTSLRVLLDTLAHNTGTKIENMKPQQMIKPRSQQNVQPEMKLQQPQMVQPNQFMAQQNQFGQPPQQFNAPPPKFNQGPPQFNPPQFNQPPPQFNQPPPQFNQPPPQFKPPQFNQPPPQNQMFQVNEEEDKEMEVLQRLIQEQQQLEMVETCKFCKNRITPEEEKEGRLHMIQSTDCFHMIHKNCFKKIVKTATSKGQSPQCPECQGIIQEFEIRSILEKKDLDELEQLQKLNILKANPNLIQCSCGDVMELVQGQVDYNQKDDQGQPISRDAAVHMSKFRVRCGSCNKNFCSNCSTEPYHLGKTCQQFKEFKEAKKCRFCNTKMQGAPASMKPAFSSVCRSAECMELMNKSCDKMLACGHACCGCKDEGVCLPCLQEECVKKNEQATRGKKCDDYCIICYTQGLGEAPCVQLQCQHIFHLDCILTKVKNRWPGPRIVFSFLECPECKQRISAPNCAPLCEELAESLKIEDDVMKKVVERAKFEGIDKNPRLKDKNDRFYNDLRAFAIYKLSYYQCFKCKQPYFGGMKDCEAGQERSDFKPEELVCGKCSAVSIGAGIKNCKNHGTDFIEFKCRFCCSIAQWFCWGTTHFCEPCHKKQVAGDYVTKKAKKDLPKCPGPEKCPLKIKHPENGEEYALGCAVCRNANENQKDF